jgi:hypothetical protein
MKTKNYIQKLFQIKGLTEFKPTDDILKKLGITRKRFFQILENKGNHDLTVSEKENIENWLWDLFGEMIDILKDPEELDALIDKHQMLK